MVRVRYRDISDVYIRFSDELVYIAVDLRYAVSVGL